MANSGPAFSKNVCLLGLFLHQIDSKFHDRKRDISQFSSNATSFMDRSTFPSSAFRNDDWNTRNSYSLAIVQSICPKRLSLSHQPAPQLLSWRKNESSVTGLLQQAWFAWSANKFSGDGCCWQPNRHQMKETERLSVLKNGILILHPMQLHHSRQTNRHCFARYGASINWFHFSSCGFKHKRLEKTILFQHINAKCFQIMWSNLCSIVRLKAMGTKRFE